MMAKKFREALIDALDRSGWKLQAVCEVAGVSYEQMKKVRAGKSQSTNVDDAIKVAHAFGMSLDEFIGDTTIADRAETAALWLRLSEAERAILLAAARGQAVSAQAAAPKDRAE